MFPMDIAKDKDGLPRKVVGTSVVAVVDFGEEGGKFRGVLCILEGSGGFTWLHSVQCAINAGR